MSGKCLEFAPNARSDHGLDQIALCGRPSIVTKKAGQPYLKTGFLDPLSKANDQRMNAGHFRHNDHARASALDVDLFRMTSKRECPAVKGLEVEGNPIIRHR